MLLGKEKIIEVTGKLVIDYRAMEWCKLPYPGHKKGCPNYGKRPECPPQAPKVEDWIDLNKPHYFIVVKFNMAAHVKKMKSRHPEWSVRQTRNPRHWQGTVRKRLKEAVNEFINKESRKLVFTLLPEAMGVHVIITAKKLEIPIKTRPIDTVYKIVLAGYPKKEAITKVKDVSLLRFVKTVRTTKLIEAEITEKVN